MNSRRTFLKSATVLCSGIALSVPNLSSSASGKNNRIVNTSKKIHLFSKHLQWLDYNDMAKTARLIGFDGIDLTVRPNGHVLPENVQSDLPLAIAAIRKNGLIADRITTSITDPDDQTTIKILETAAKHGIKYYRMGWLSYDNMLTVRDNLERIKISLAKFERLNKQFGIIGSYQNHTSEKLGAAVWDIAFALENIDPELLGIRYDIRHAAVEGYKSWPVALKFVSDKVNSIDLKDFSWKKDSKGEWQAETVPLGEGMVDFERFISIIKEQNIKGDFTIHFEYELGGADTGANVLTISPENVIDAMKRDLSFVKNLIRTLD